MPVTGATGSSLLLCASCPANQSAPLDTIVVNPLSTAQYFVTWTPGNGPPGPGNCPRRSAVSLDLSTSPLFSPDSSVNVFTPNSDNRNDVFYPYKSELVGTAAIRSYAESYNLKVYDRWGVLLFETNDYAIAWDGNKDGVPVTDGVYYWIATYTDRCRPDVKSEQRGFVHLIR